MTTIETSAARGRSRGTRRSPRLNTRIDMTSMVDLGFLLITFFVMTARLSEPASLPLIMPDDRGISTLGESAALTVIFNKGVMAWYEGDWNTAVETGAVHQTSLDGKTGLGKIIRDKQARLDRSSPDSAGRDELMMLMKPGPESDYSTLIGVMDETVINRLRKHAIVDLSAAELAYLNTVSIARSAANTAVHPR